MNHPNGEKIENCNNCPYFQDKKCVFGYKTKGKGDGKWHIVNLKKN
jgi:hypothetical protein